MFVFRNIPGSFGSFPPRSFVFNNIPASFLENNSFGSPSAVEGCRLKDRRWRSTGNTDLNSVGLCLLKNSSLLTAIFATFLSLIGPFCIQKPVRFEFVF